jgi:8-oxo-dGTP diphosphatase
MLPATPNPFGGIVVDPATLPVDAEVFSAYLHYALEEWTAQAFKVVWLEIPITKAHLIPFAVEAGFQFHHSGDDYLMLTYRLAPDAFIPPYATHYIGAGGVVLNEKRELLVIWEKAHWMRNHRYYKLPGGALHLGEHLVDGVIREVFEETGIRTQFESLLCFRHWHGYRFGKSDIYFICRLSPLNHDIVIQESEIEECLWMPVDEYLNNEFVGVFNRRVVEIALTGQGLVPTWFEGYDVERETREIFVAQTCE